MLSRNWEDWAMALPLAIAAGLVLTLGEVRTPSFAGDAVAAERSAPQYVMTITAKRLPAECKGLSDQALPAQCRAIIDGATVTMRENR